MTDAQIEAVARAYCAKLGLDPDQKEWGPMGEFKPAWYFRTHIVREALAMREVIAEVLGEKGEQE